MLSSKLSILGLSKITSKNQIKENLFHQKLKALVHSIDSSDFIPHHSKLQKCLLCAKIYSIHESDSKTQLIKPVQTCPKQLQGVDFYGQLSSPRTKDKSFNVDAYINQLHEQKGDWISVYWNVFGQLYFMNCIECHAYLNCIDFLYPGCTHLSSTTQCSCSRSFEPFKKSGCCKTYHKPDLEFCAFKEYFEEFKLNVGQDSVDAHSLSNEYDGVLSFHQWVACPIQDRPIQKSYMIRDQDTANFYDLSAEMIKCRQI